MKQHTKAPLKQPLPADWHHAGIGQLASHLVIGPNKVLAWINAGELIAANIATSPTSRPVYRIRRADFDKFWLARSAHPASITPATAPRRRSAAIREFV